MVKILSFLNSNIITYLCSRHVSSEVHFIVFNGVCALQSVFRIVATQPNLVVVVHWWNMHFLSITSFTAISNVTRPVHMGCPPPSGQVHELMMLDTRGCKPGWGIGRMRELNGAVRVEQGSG